MLKRHRIVMAYMLALAVFTAYVLLDTFVITRVYGEEVPADGQETEDVQNSDESAGDGGSSEQDAASTEDAEAGNMHGSGDGSGGSGGHAPGQNGSQGQGQSRGPGGHSGKGPGKHSGSTDSSSQQDAADSSDSSSSQDASDSSGSTNAVSTGDTYSDGNVKITLKEYRENDSTIYVADVQLSSALYLKTALAQGSYGKNVTQKTSEIAENVNAILAVNGDYYGAQEKGYVIRNGKLYRSTAIANQEDLVIYKDGSFGIINESDVTAEELLEKGAVQILSFGPALVQNGKIAVTQDEEVGKAMASNPRTALGIIDDNHYVFVVSDGRTSESEGLSLYELAEFMDSLGAETAYNLDGGGSSTMYFNGSVVNNPTTGGSSTRERSVSDIVYIG